MGQPNNHTKIYERDSLTSWYKITLDNWICRKINQSEKFQNCSNSTLILFFMFVTNLDISCIKTSIGKLCGSEYILSSCTITVPNRRFYNHLVNGFMRVWLRLKWYSDPVVTLPTEKMTNTQNSGLVHKHKSFFATTLFKQSLGEKNCVRKLSRLR